MRLGSLLLVLAVLGLTLAAQSSAGSCPLYSASDAFFYPSPTAVQPSLFGYSSACCTPAYAAQVGSASDALTSGALAKLSKPTASCSAAVQSVAASLCSPSSGLWVTAHSYGRDLALCPSFCASLKDNCASSTLLTTGTPVATTDAQLLCVALFTTVDAVTPSASWRPYVASFDNNQRPSCLATSGACTANDYQGVYTTCNGQTRSVVYSWKNTSSCQGGDVALPAPVTDLPCNLTCAKGSYLPIGSRTCQPCPAGTFSFGGGVRINTWKEWPQVPAFALSTYCINNRNGATLQSGFDAPCGWKLNGTQIVSGDVDDSQSSVLELRTFVNSVGAIEFSYQIDAEANWDGLKFFVDGVLVFTALTPVPEWRVFRTSLAAGPHVIQFHFYKDASFSGGLDAVFIGYIQLEGTDYIPGACTPCLAGTFSAPGATNCSICPVNTYSAAQSSSCTSCADSDYAYAGSPTCTARPACKTTDYEFYYSPCSVGPSGPQRSRLARWVEPRICLVTNVSLPAPVDGLPCAPCNPGQYRSGADCVFCSAGNFANASGAASCAPCPAGTSPVVTRYYTNWDAMPADFSTRCNGDGCGTPGWRFLGDFADSGTGHGYPAESVLIVPLDLTAAGELKLSFTFDCLSSCSFSVRFSGQSTGRFTIYNSDGNFTKTVPIRAGAQNAELLFVKTSASWGSRTDRVKLNYLSVTNSRVGGGANCTSCPLGYSSEQGAANCTICPPGTFRNASMVACQPCAANAFSSAAGQTACETCGNGVFSTPDRTQCDLRNCTFLVAPGVVYDLSPLRRAQEMWGPIYDIGGHTYYMNVCNRLHSNRTCVDDNGVPIPSYACQVTSSGAGKDLGHVIGYYPLNGTLIDQGLVLEYLHGTYSSTCRRERSSHVTFVCDPVAGIGYPAGIEPVEVQPCFYQFTWQSRYACPLCTDDDYYPELSACINGSQTRTWKPLNNPQLCVDDYYAVKPPEVLACQSSDISCPPGQYLSTDPRTLVKSCLPAPAGFYSEGGAISWRRFSPMPAAFEGNWLPAPFNAMSGVGTTVMELRVNLVVPGNITFDYKVYATGNEEAGEGFYFYVDGDAKVAQVTTTNFRYVTYTSRTPLSAGPHVFRWTFRGGDLPSETLRFKGALVRSVVVVGVSKAALYPTPCPAGYYTPAPGYSACLTCPRDTVSGAGSSSCSPCVDTQHYALPGSSVCLQKQPCTMDDFIEAYTDCSNGTRTLSYSPLQPQICRIDPAVFVPPASAQVACGPCPPGSHRSGDACVKCPLGTGHMMGMMSNTTDTMNCVDAPPGKFAMPVASYFIDDSTTSLPSGFSTFCSGGGCLSSGWRPMGDMGVDSGLHGPGEIDSVLDLRVAMIVPGSVSFVYKVVGSRVDGLEFFIDEDQQPLVYHPIDDDREVEVTASFAVSSGSHLLRWVYHQDRLTAGYTYVQMRDIEVRGSSAGACDMIEECQPGTYTDSPRQLACQPCPAGSVTAASGASSCSTCVDNTYQDSTGETSCVPCGQGTLPSADHTHCTTDHCSFRLEGGVFNFSAVQDVTFRSYYAGTDLIFRLCDYIDQQLAPSCPDNVFVCGVDASNGVSLNLGSRLAVQKLSDASTNTSGVRFMFDLGDLCQGGTYYSTYLTDYCYDDESNPPIRRRISYNEAFCRYEITAYGLSGCPQCTDADYKLVKSECSDGVRVVAVERQTTCNGPATLSSRTESCSASYETPLWVFFGLILGFSIIGGLLIFFIVKHRQVTVQYEVLAGEEARRTATQRADSMDRDDVDNADL